MLEELLEKVKKYNPTADLEKIESAYYYAEKAHEGQYRNSGERFFIHPYAVAMILADLHMDTDTVIAGLFHDVLEDSDITYEEMSEKFGKEITDLVDGVTKLKKLKFKTKEESQAENLRKMVMAMAEDIRVIIVKLADRLHNMRTLEYMSEEKKKEKALETLEIYAPLAHRLGISKIKWELEDLSLRYLDPKGYYDLVEKVSKRRKEREEYIESIILELNENLDDMGIDKENRDISGRPKSFYSIYRKMVYQDKTFEQILDLTAIRVIVESVKDCYAVLGIVHTLWKPLPGRFKDYIAMPKPNMYQSLHTTVIGPKGEIFEVQIRTWDMHETSEYGIAAHWRYKEGNTDKADTFDDKLTWLRQLMEWQSDVKDPKDFMESLKIDLFTDEVYIFTPRGDVINLPNGSTPIDFAYRVHTDVGHKCVGAKIDGRIVPLDYKLKNGNIVEVLTSSSSGGPSRDWLKIVKSNQAKSKIRQWFKREDKDVNIDKGRTILEKDARKHGYVPSEILKEDWVKVIANKLSYNSSDDLYAAIGFGTVIPSQIMPKLKDFYKEHNKEDEEKALKEKVFAEEKYSKPKNTPNKAPVKGGISIKGVDNIKVRFSKCCNPVPGDEIVGFITRGRGVSVHRKDCTNIKNLEGTEQRFIEVQWEGDEKAAYPAEIQIKASDRAGLLMELTREITESDLELLSINARTNKEKIVIVNMTLEIKNRTQLDTWLKKVKKMDGVIDSYRVIS